MPFVAVVLKALIMIFLARPPVPGLGLLAPNVVMWFGISERRKERGQKKQVRYVVTKIFVRLTRIVYGLCDV